MYTFFDAHCDTASKIYENKEKRIIFSLKIKNVAGFMFITTLPLKSL